MFPLNLVSVGYKIQELIKRPYTPGILCVLIDHIRQRKIIK